MRWVFAVIVSMHGLIHLMGFAKAFGFAELPQLTQPISRPMGALWLVAGALMLAVAFLPWRWLWLVGPIAVVLSQIVIVSSWSDARFGTIANVIALLGVAFGFAATGPVSLRTEWEHEVDALLAKAPSAGVLTEAEVAKAPLPVQRYLRLSGAVGRPRVVTFRATWKGRIRATADGPWMEIAGTQYNDAVGERPSRLFFFEATQKGLPADVFHRFVGDEASFRVRLLSMVPVVDARGVDLRRAETVTILNDLCLMAPGALLQMKLESIDANRVRATYTRGSETVSADLVFDAEGHLVDFFSDDRFRGPLDDGRFEQTRWSTPLTGYRTFGDRTVASKGEARWYPASGAFTYIELELVDFAANPATRE